MSECEKRDEDKIERKLREWFSEARKVVIAGIGNSLRRDDFVGVKIVRDLHDSASSDVYLIECETVPESFIEPIIEFNPSHMLIIDAAMLKLKPGSSKLLSSEQLMERPAVSSHDLPLQVFCEYVSRATGAKIALLLIQPGDTRFGEGLTREVQEAADCIGILLSRLLCM